MTQTEINQDNRFCLFRSQADVLALAATHVRSVSPQPEVTPIPFADEAMAGIAYMQNEFLPVYELCHLMQSQASDMNSQKQLLLVSLDEGDFGLLVNQVLGLESLEISYTGSTAGIADWSNVISGAATYRDQFVSVIDPTALAQMLGERLQAVWTEFGQLIS